MATQRIIARYLKKEGFNSINDREVDLDEYEEIKVDSISEGCELISKGDVTGNGIGVVIEQTESQYGFWDDDVEHLVEAGKVYDHITY